MSGLDDGELAHLCALADLPEVGPARLRYLRSLGRPSDTWRRVTAGERLADAPVSPDLLSRWRAAGRVTDVERCWERTRAAGITVLDPSNGSYPRWLVDDPDRPEVLFVSGTAPLACDPGVAVVGTRRATAYGSGVAFELGAALAERGVTVVSGLALGIDGAAHAGVLSVDGAPPVAVVGTGLDVVYPVRNRELWRAVERGGAVISETPPGGGALPWRFPARNRIIAAAVSVVVVVESQEAGGSMHTVREADRRGRTIMAVPGPVRSSTSSGTNQLLAEGVAPCRDAEDVLVALGLAGTVLTSTPLAPLAGDRRWQGDAAAVLDALGWAPATFDQLALRTGLDVCSLTTAVASLEAGGALTQERGWIEQVDHR